MNRREFHAATLATLAAGLGERADTPAAAHPADPLPPGASLRLGSSRFQPLSDLSDPGLDALAFSPDGTLLATLGGQDGRVSLWTVPSGQLVREWDEGPWESDDGVGPWLGAGLAFSPDGRLLAVCGLGVRVWDPAAGRRLWEASDANPYQTEAVAFSPDGRLVVTADGMRGTATVLDAASGRPLHRVQADPDPLGDATQRADWFSAVAVSPDGRLLAAGGGYEILHPYTGRVPSAAAVKAMLGDLLTSDPQKAIAELNKFQSVPEPPDMEALFDRLGAEYGGCATRDGPDGRQWVPEPRGRVSVWDLHTSEWLTVLDGRHTHPVRQVGFAADGSLVSVGDNGATHVWNPTTGTHRRELVGPETPRPAVVLLPGGRVLVGRAGGLTVLDPLTGAAVPTPGLPPWAGWSKLARSADGRWLAADLPRTGLEVWDTHAGRGCAPPDRHAGRIDGLAVTPDGAAAFTAGEAELFEWDLRTGDRVRTYPVDDGRLDARPLAVSPDGGRVAAAFDRWVGGPDSDLSKPGVCVADRAAGTVRVWPAPGWVSALAWAADGLLIGAWTEKANGRLVLHPLAAGRKKRAFDAAGGRILDLAVSPDGRQVAGVGWDDPIEKRTNFLQVWHAAGRTADRFPLPLAAQMSVGGLRVRFAPDSRTLAVASSGGEVFVGPAGGPPGRRFVAPWPEDGWADAFALGFTPAGRPLVARVGWEAAGDGGGLSAIRVWDVLAGAEMWRSPPSAAGVGPLEFSPDGRRLLAGSRGTTVLVWELPPG